MTPRRSWPLILVEGMVGNRETEGHLNFQGEAWIGSSLHFPWSSFNQDDLQLVANPAPRRKMQSW